MRLTGDMGRLRGALVCLKSKDHWQVKEREGQKYQCKAETVEIPQAIQNRGGGEKWKKQDQEYEQGSETKNRQQHTKQNTKTFAITAS